MDNKLTRSLALLAAGLLLAACGGEPPRETATSRDATARAVEIVPHTVAYRADRTRVEAVGTARARHAALIFPETGGEVTGVTFEAGDRVSNGDILASPCATRSCS